MAANKNLFHPLMEESSSDGLVYAQPRKLAPPAAKSSTLNAVALGALVVALAVALFVGGFYAGKSRASHSSEPCAAENAQTAASVAVLAGSMGTQATAVQALQGNVAVESFVMCLTVVTANGVTCYPTIPTLSRKGKIQLTVYQEGQDVSWVFTVSGSNFGSSAATGAQELSFTLNVKGLAAQVMELGDPVHQELARRNLLPSEDFTADFSVTDGQSQGIVFTWVNMSASAPLVQLYLSNVVGGSGFDLELTGTTTSVPFTTLPSAANPLLLRASTQANVAAPTASRTWRPTENVIASTPTSSISIGVPDARRRRDGSTASAESFLAGFNVTAASQPSNVLARIEYFLRDSANNDAPGLSMTVTNYTVAKSAVLMLSFHEYLPLFGNYTAFVLQMLSSENIRQPFPLNSTVSLWKNSAYPVKNLVGNAPLPAWLGGTLARAQQELNTLQNTIQQDRRRHFSWHCALDIGKSILRGVECGADLVGGDYYNAVSDCYGAGKDIVHAHKKC